MAHDVFISYKSENVNAAIAICNVLEKNNIQCWMAPRNLNQSAGLDYDDKILQAIIGAKVVVAVLTEEAMQSKWVKTEITEALDRGKIVVPYQVGEIKIDNGLLMRLKTAHWLESFPDYKEKFTLLVTSVSKLLEKDAPLSATEMEEINSMAQAQDNKKKKQNIIKYSAIAAVVVAVVVIAIVLLTPKSSNQQTSQSTESTTQIPPQQALSEYEQAEAYYKNGTYKEAISHYEKAAESGSAKAQNRLGDCYYNGNGVEINYDKAVYWYEKAAKQGLAEAQCSLGLCYANGDGVKLNVAKAKQLLQAAASQKNAMAIEALNSIE